MRRVLIIFGAAVVAWLASCGEPVAQPAADPTAAAAGPGEMVELAGGRRMLLNCAGQGAPAVILNADTGSGAGGWREVQSALAGETTVCSFNRAGYDPSDPGPYPRNARAAAADMADMLAAAEIKGPYLLVGHGRGAVDVRVFGRLYPGEVAGMVLVDPEIDDPAALAAFPWTRRERAGEALRCLRALAEDRLGPNDPEYEPCGEPVVEFLATPQEARTVLSEIETLETDLAALGDEAHLRDVPLMVLTAGMRFAGEPEANEREIIAAQEIWNRAQAAIAAKSARGLQVIVPGANHFLPASRPEAVVEAVRSVLRQITGRVTV